jgi:hypothetical protein
MPTARKAKLIHDPETKEPQGTGNKQISHNNRNLAFTNASAVGG